VRVVLRDTTLREGIQMPGSRITLEQKREFISLLNDIGVPEIEIGLPDGLAACLEVSDLIRENGFAIRATALIPFYTQRWKKHIDLAAEHNIHRIDVLGPTSDYLLSDPTLYGMRPEEIQERLQPVLEYARQTPLEIGVGLIDATRAPLDRILAIVKPLKDLGVTRLIVYDSVGIMIPSKMKSLVAEILKASNIPVLVHCHNDYGMATANSLASIEGGATAVDVAVNGIGGRAGNAALEEVALALENLFGYSTGIDTHRFRQLAELTERITGLRNSPTKPIVGDYCFAHLPVMHIRCIAGGNPSAFEPFPPEQIGTRRTYHFNLPVDYTVALQPFLQKSGKDVKAEEIPRLLATLKEREGCTEEEILEIIRSVHEHESASI
jgi:isopropylmalate/homocitrate/citramalate synthase